MNQALDKLRELRSRRPWQLLLIGEEAAQLTPEDVEALTRVLDLLPHVAELDVQTTVGPVRISRDFSGDYVRQVDQLLAGIFERNAAVTGITFPAKPDRLPHTATPNHPHWSPRG